MPEKIWYDINKNDSNLVSNTGSTFNVKKLLQKNKNVNLLEHTWVLWCHDIKDSNWGKDSYIKVFSFNTIEDFWKLYKNLNNIDSIMLFLMKEGIFPLWEDPENKSGGCWSYKIKKKDNFTTWKNLSMSVVGNFLTQNDEIMKNINGISFNPHLYNSVIKIWSKTNDFKDNLDEFKTIDILKNLDPIYKVHEVEY
jgi:hypothetical protein